MLDALRSAAALEGEGSEGSAAPGGGGTCTPTPTPTWPPSTMGTGGAGWRSRAAAVEALVSGLILEKSLGGWGERRGAECQNQYQLPENKVQLECCLELVLCRDDALWRLAKSIFKVVGYQGSHLCSF